MAPNITPGPWVIRVQGNGNEQIFIDANSIPLAAIAGEKIADIPRVQAGRLANAQLIAAAPDIVRSTGAN